MAVAFHIYKMQFLLGLDPKWYFTGNDVAGHDAPRWWHHWFVELVVYIGGAVTVLFLRIIVSAEIVLGLWKYKHRWFLNVVSWLEMFLMSMMVSNKFNACAQEKNGAPGCADWNSLLTVMLALVIFVARLCKKCGAVLLLRPWRKGAAQRMKSVHFVWVTQKPEAFVWFFEELKVLQQGASAGIFSFELYCTRATGPQRLLEIPASSLPEGLAVHLGRPDYTSTFSSLLSSRFRKSAGESVGIFYCGSVGMGTAVRDGADHALENDMRYNDELLAKDLVRFSFFKENF